MSAEVIAEGFGYAVAVLALLAGSFWWGWQLRGELSVKLEYFRITNRAWRRYDRDLRSSPAHHVPLRGEIHDMGERSEK